MKQLLFILFLLPVVGFSQVLIKDVSRMSYLNTPKNLHKTSEVLTNMSIFVENGYLYIKDDLETLKYKIIKIHNIVDKGEKVTVYEILINKEKHLASISNYKKSRAILLESVDDTDATIFYDKEGN